MILKKTLWAKLSRFRPPFKKNKIKTIEAKILRIKGKKDIKKGKAVKIRGGWSSALSEILLNVTSNFSHVTIHQLMTAHLPLKI